MILVWLILIPFIAGLLSWQAELRFGPKYPRWIALTGMLLALGISVWLWMAYDYSLPAVDGATQWVIEYKAPWIPRFGISFHFALDGLSILLVLLTNLLGVMAIICSWKEIDRNVGFFHLNLLWNLGGVVGVFLTLDLFLFFFLWEMMLVPMYFLIALWGHDSPGGKGKVYAATKFFLFTQASGLIMLLAILGLVFVNYQATNVITFNYEDLLKTQMSANVEYVLMLGFFIAFAVKTPAVPFHTWLPDAHSQAPTAGSVDLAGILLKTAAYGMLRFGIPLFPNASADFAPIAMWLGVAGIVYGGVMVFAQTDVKRLVAYSSVSHMGFILVGVYAGTEIALQGVVIQMLAHGISAGALFILCGEIYERLHTRDLRKMGGLWSRFPYLPPITLFFVAASLGLPGLGNFIGEFLVLIGSWPADPVVTIFASTGLILAAVYSLMMIQRAFHGPTQEDHHGEKLQDLNARELGMLGSLMILMLWLGLYPQPFLNTSASAMQHVAAIYAAAQPEAAAGVAP
ncbi:NADH dehydrogenase subunit M [Panacagrimonas perspica]|uniref:NADH-quinone oxidoreductase subunit M n=1 Tax=Panacagrimonas perspica TaxID=381431 RepID=A0A4R7P5T3_9GAMM|nr:NADH-quinone oxidoreductase subunit M [Panacagrimonas perspica]TDU28822.1 NADH dehydrogenase subunit M [Panacagrimonas perspica]THD02345.1 NADH-quinone oxidoreductase subunit M [Panacagrimonas perspica]